MIHFSILAAVVGFKPEYQANLFLHVESSQVPLMSTLHSVQPYYRPQSGLSAVFPQPSHILPQKLLFIYYFTQRGPIYQNKGHG